MNFTYAETHPFAGHHHGHGGHRGFRAMAAGRGHGRGPGRGRHGGWDAAGFGGPGRGGRRRRMRRGDVRAALLVLLAEEPRNGYGLMQEIENRSEGVWRPSPGSVYPALAQLEDEGLVTADKVDGGRTFTLTDAGRTYVEENREGLGEPWAAVHEEMGEGRVALRHLVGQLAAAAMQVGSLGSDENVEAARRILVDARKALYRILADED
jgi:DNA-binding PadR family transcriptional regulator